MAGGRERLSLASSIKCRQLLSTESDDIDPSRSVVHKGVWSGSGLSHHLPLKNLQLQIPAFGLGMLYAVDGPVEGSSTDLLITPE